MNKRFVVLVLDGFGIGATSDASVMRPGDENSNTFGSILEKFPKLKLTNLEKLGLMNAYGKESEYMKFNSSALYGKSALMHAGADTFMGHQEIMGTIPKAPKSIPFQEKIDDVKEHLLKSGHKVEERNIGCLRYLLVDDYCTVADNIDADLGMAYNCTAPLSLMTFEHVLEIAKCVREVVQVNRVIPFGGTSTKLSDILNAEETRENKFIGIHAVKSKSYEQGYECRHLGYGVDWTIQVPAILANHNIAVSLFGKVADVVTNENGKSVSCVSTNDVLDLTIEELKRLKEGFICTNVQETDLAGHSQDPVWYKNLLEICDEKIGVMLGMLEDEDIMLIMADHGNDPNIGHNRHTRENVPILIYKKNAKPNCIGTRTTLSDVGATVCDYFGTEPTQNGESFLKYIKSE